MYLTPKRVALGGGLIGLIILICCVVSSYNKALYVANLDTRPLNVGLVGIIESLEPAVVATGEEQLIASALYEGLVLNDSDSGTIKPAIASDWRFSNDGKSLIINLKNGVKFCNGKIVNAKDVKASWEKSLSTSKDYEKVSLFLSIVGSSEFLEGKTTDISGIIVVNDKTLKINFYQPNAAFIYMLNNPIFWVYDCEDKTTPAPGTGPYVLKENKDNKEFILSRNDKYRRGLPRVTAIKINLFRDVNRAFDEYKAGKLDYLDTVPIEKIKDIRNNEQYKKLFIEKPLLSIYAIGFNVNKEPFVGNYHLRRALNYAIDRSAIIENVMGHSYRAIKGAVPLGVTGYNREMPGYTYNPQKAADLLKEAGYPLGEGLKPLTIVYNNNEGHRMVLQSISEQLAQLGIEVQLTPMEWDYYQGELKKMNFMCYRIGWSADYPDTDSFLYSLFHSSNIGISNFSGYTNQQVDKILDASREETKSQQERIKLMNRAEEIIVDDAPYLWLFQKNAAKLIGKQVNSLNINNMGMVDWYSIELLKPSSEGSKL
jgi:peptide/nickel transport system substrate-binding protein/oligopeptide transport system substrate-binding protein